MIPDFKLIALICILATIFLNNQAAARQYDGQGPGESTIGIGGDYPSLYTACDAISSHPLTGGDWTFLILNDLVEPNNVSLTQGASHGHTITFRPAPSTTPTVTFTTTTANNSGLPGHFNIGARVDRPSVGGSYVAVPTQHIAIDGSNDPTTSACSMTWKNTGRHDGSSPLLAVYGDSDYITIRNCNIEFQTPGFNERYNRAAVEFSSFTFAPESGQSDLVPDFGRIENCHIELEDAYSYGYGISFNNRTVGEKDFAYPPAMGMVAKNNEIVSGAEAIIVRNCADPLLTGNNILIKARLRGSRYALQCIGAATPGDNGRVLIDSNTIVCTGTQLSYWTATAVNAAKTSTTFILTNNMISSLGDSAITGKPSDFTKIAGVVGLVDESSTITLAHNSINFHTAVPNPVQGQYRAVEASGNIEVRNNIFRMNADNAAVFVLPEGYGTSFTSNNNIIYTTSTGHLARVGPSVWPNDNFLNSLTDWQTSSGQDMASVIHDPYVPAASGLGIWMGQPDDPNQDLHFSSFPGEMYLVPAIPAVETDFDGEQRSSDSTVAGADEVQRLTSVENWQLF